MIAIKGFLRLLFGVMAALTVAALGQAAWTSWQDLRTAESSKVAARASAAIFTTMVNLRMEGSLTKGMLDRPEPGTPLPYWAPAREAEVKGMTDAIAALKSANMPDRDTLVAKLESQLAALVALHKETAAAIPLPAAQRPAKISDKYTDFNLDLRTVLNDVGPAMQASVLLKDPLVDQWLALHNLAWAMRSASGDAMTNITNNLAVMGKMPEDANLLQAAMLERVDFVWATINDRLKALPQSAEVTKAIAEAKRDYFDPAFRAQQITYLKQLMAGQKPDIARDRWDRLTVPKTMSLANVAVGLINAASQAADAKADAAQRSLEVALALLVGSLLFTAAVFVAIGRRITGPLEALTSNMRTIADGAFDTEIGGVGRRDEIGAMAGTLAIFRDGLRRNRELELESTQGREASERERKAMLADLASQFESVVVGIVSSVSSSAGELEGAATTLRGATEETSQRSNNVAAAAEQASSNVANVASAAEELGASVQEIGRQISSSAEMSEAAVKEARSTAVVVGELSEAAHRISDVLGLISSIAGQTNLLALNATIEAARAGEAGRGFAVVAAEVKELADQTAKATADISAQINAIQGSTGRAVEAIGGIAERIEGMNRVTLEVSDSIKAQNAATSEIVHSIAQASAGASEVTGNITGVAQAALNSGAIVNQVLSASTMLASKASQMRDEVDRFLKTVRSA